MVPQKGFMKALRLFHPLFGVKTVGVKQDVKFKKWYFNKLIYSILISVILAYYDLPIVVHDLARSNFEFLVFLYIPRYCHIPEQGCHENSALSTSESLVTSNCLLASVSTKLMLYRVRKRWADSGPFLKK